MTDLAVTLGVLVRSVPGVESLYASTPTVVALTDAAIGSIVRDREQRHPVSVTAATGGVTVSAVIGIAEEASATDVCRRVYDVIAAHLFAAGLPVASIEVRVGSIG